MGIPKGGKMKKYLEYPSHYDEELANKVNNGCGTAGWKGKLVPDSIYGFSIKESCKVHDFEYHVGKNKYDKRKADKRFHRNMKATIKKKSNWRNGCLNPLRYARAWIYYKSVVKFGGGPFKDKVEG